MLDKMTGQNVLSYHICSPEAATNFIEGGQGILGTRGGQVQSQMSPPWCGLDASSLNSFVDTNTPQTACAAINLPVSVIRGHPVGFDTGMRCNLSNDVPLDCIAAIWFDANRYYYDKEDEAVRHTGKDMELVWSQYMDECEVVAQAYLRSNSTRTMPTDEDVVLVNGDGQLDRVSQVALLQLRRETKT